MTAEAGNGEARTDEEEAGLFAEFFASVVTDEEYRCFEPSRRHLCGKNEVGIGQAGITTELKKLDLYKSLGIDSAPPIIPKKK